MFVPQLYLIDQYDRITGGVNRTQALLNAVTADVWHGTNASATACRHAHQQLSQSHMPHMATCDADQY